MRFAARLISVLTTPHPTRQRAEKRILVCHLARSGSHAVINWIASQCGDTTFYNNCNEALQPLKRPDRWRCTGKPTAQIYSAENFDIEGFEQVFGSHDLDHVLLINRDIYNLVASSIHRKGDVNSILTEPFQNLSHFKTAWFGESKPRLEMWKTYIRASQKLTHESDEHFVDVNFNKWFSDQAYRRALADRLEIPFTDAGLTQVMNHGEGSSFDKRQYDGRAQDMRVLERWRSYANDERFWSLIDEQCHALNASYFGFRLDPQKGEVASSSP